MPSAGGTLPPPSQVTKRMSAMSACSLPAAARTACDQGLHALFGLSPRSAAGRAGAASRCRRRWRPPGGRPCASSSPVSGAKTVLTHSRCMRRAVLGELAELRIAPCSWASMSSAMSPRTLVVVADRPDRRRHVADRGRALRSDPAAARTRCSASSSAARLPNWRSTVCTLTPASRGDVVEGDLDEQALAAQAEEGVAGSACGSPGPLVPGPPWCTSVSFSCQSQLT